MKNKVFFNNSCNICRAEINHYKKHSDGNLEWVDVTDNQDAQQLTSKSYKDLLRRMHVIQDGKVIDGAESFLIIWRATSLSAIFCGEVCAVAAIIAALLIFSG